MLDEQQDVKEVVEAVQPQETQTIQQPLDAQEVSKEEPKEGSKEYNFARLREKNELLERQNQEMMGALRQIQDSLKAKEPPPVQEVDELASLGDDDIITKKQAFKAAERMAKKIVQESLAIQEKQSLPHRTRQQFNDFDEVLTDENIKEFEKSNPVLAGACTRADNPWQAAYEAIKMSPIYQDRKARKQMEKDSKKIDENISKPISSNAIGKPGALANANSYGEMSRDELYREMQKAARQA
jgi:hypothetical protein